MPPHMRETCCAKSEREGMSGWKVTQQIVHSQASLQLEYFCLNRLLWGTVEFKFCTVFILVVFQNSSIQLEAPVQYSGHICHRIKNYSMNISTSAHTLQQATWRRWPSQGARGTNTSSIWQALGAARSRREQHARSRRRPHRQLPPA